MTEVACGVVFAPLKAMLAPHLGLLWERFKREYPECQEAPLIAMQMEGPRDTQAGVDVFLQVPPLPRIWFIATAGDKLIQIQRERFHHNWRKANAEDEYPRHERVIQLFNERLETFQIFLRDHELGELQFTQYELTYVNHIPEGVGWNSVSEIGRVFPDFSWRDSGDRFLTVPEAIDWNTSFLLPDGMGRLRVAIRNAIRVVDNQPILFFELTARGFGKEASQQSMHSWFEMAHIQIVRTFDDMVDKDFQKIAWRRKS